MHIYIYTFQYIQDTLNNTNILLKNIITEYYITQVCTSS
jgi:hypothetical protein